jgi:SAM-dependent methyltransferase
LKEEKGKDWLEVIREQFDHPATILWRAIEVAHFEEAIGKFEPGGLILDLGCAEGKIGGILFNDRRIYGLDNCWELLSQNKRADTYRTLILADACKMPLKDKTFGCVFSNSVIEHIPDLDSLLSAVKNILKDRGLFIFTVPSDKFGEYLFFSAVFSNLRLNSLAEKYINLRNKRLNHFHCYDHNIWKQRLEQNNLKIIGYSYYISKKAAMAWDFLAAIAFIMNKLKLHKLIEYLNTVSLQHLRRIVRLDSARNDSGAGLLIIAEKI